MAEQESTEKALELLRSIRNELARGTEHYSKSGTRLTTVMDVLQCLLDEGGVYIKPAGMPVETIEMADEIAAEPADA